MGVNATVRTFREFLNATRRFTLDERKVVVDQALLILENNYVHLPFKRSMHGIDPLQQLRLLQTLFLNVRYELFQSYPLHSHTLPRVFQVLPAHDAIKLPIHPAYQTND